MTKSSTTDKIAVVLMSGGLDSSTCLAIAIDLGYSCYCLSFDYGQRAKSELLAAQQICKQMNVIDHQIISLDIGRFGGSSLTDTSLAIPEQETEGIPTTYVPARNTVFLSFALALAEVKAASAIYIGVNALDYSGYPDCRPEFIESFETMANLATRAAIEGNPVKIETPLIAMSKADIIRRGYKLGVNYARTVSCYQADDRGRACGRCDSCRLRRKGFSDAGIDDPTRYMQE